MHMNEVTARSPIRSLEQAMNGELGAGQVGVLAGAPGTGKTACLAQLGLDALLRGNRVVHVSSEAPVGHLRTYYDEFFREIGRSLNLRESQAVQLELEQRRLLVSLPGPPIGVGRLIETAAVAQGALGKNPDLLLLEGFDWDQASEALLQELRNLASRLGSSVWLSARTHRDVPVDDARGYPPPVDRLEGLLDAIVLLDPSKAGVHLRVCKGLADKAPKDGDLYLDAVTLQLVQIQAQGAATRLRDRAVFTLHSGGAKGAEALFGEMAERYGLAEITFSFEGHASRVRARGLRELSESELRTGDVSLRYVSQKLARTFPSQPSVQKVLQSIWHQIRPCQQVFVVGTIQHDGTVRGGTGWGAELARRWKLELYTFDQDRDQWFGWDGSEWQPTLPVIRSPRFAGTGTRELRENGARAIESLFERSFGQP